MDKTYGNINYNDEKYSPHNYFDNMYDNSKDVETIEWIINELKKYDIYDFISRISALNLVPKNQSKCILFDALIESILCSNISKYTSSNIMSSGKFKNIITRLNNMDLKASLDPPENTFIERIMFFGENYLIFSGINYLPGYTLQMLINNVFLNKNDFNDDFKRKCCQIASLVLMISDYAAHGEGYSIENLEMAESDIIVTPNTQRMQRMKNHTIIEQSIINQYINIKEFEERFCYSFTEREISTVINAKEQGFFTKPFLKSKNDNYIVLNISILPYFLIHQIVCLAQDYNFKDYLISTFTTDIWRDCRKSLKMLEHTKVQESSLGVTLQNSDIYKEALFNVYNNQILIVICLCDNGQNYSKSEIFSDHPSNKFGEILVKRLEYFYEKLKAKGISRNDVFIVILFAAYGRAIRVNTQLNSYYKPLRLNPYELKCIAINERENESFIPRYIKAVSKIKTFDSGLLSELNSIDIYVSNEYSFYINDDFNMNETNLFIAPGDSIDYIIKSLQKENRHLIDSYIDGYFAEVVLIDPSRNIYTTKNSPQKNINMLIKLENINIWLYSTEENNYKSNLYYSIIDTISYWIAECKETIQNNEFKFDYIKISITLIGDHIDYLKNIPENRKWSELIEHKLDKNELHLAWSPEALRSINYNTNVNEKHMVHQLIKYLLEFTYEKSFDSTHFDTIFNNTNKKKIITLDYMNDPYIKPINNSKFQRIRYEDENELLDDIGQCVLSKNKWSYGLIPTEDRTEIAHHVVEHLYSSIKKDIETLDNKNLIELIYFDLEKTLFNQMLVRQKYIHDVACYPENKSLIFEKNNELNKSSMALKFLIEYVASCPPSGKEILGKWKYEIMLAKCSLIIDWAYKNDLFYYNIFNTPIEILKSGRIGMKQDEFYSMQSLYKNYQENQFNYNESAVLKRFSLSKVMPDINKKLDSAFMEEYGFTYTHLVNCVFAIIEYGNSQTSDIKKELISVLAYNISSNNKELTLDKIVLIIEFTSLKKRDDFLVPPIPYRKEDVYPWRFNRELSFIRRPLIQRDDKVI